MKAITMFITAMAVMFMATINSHAQGLYAGVDGGYGFASGRLGNISPAGGGGNGLPNFTSGNGYGLFLIPATYTSTTLEGNSGQNVNFDAPNGGNATITSSSFSLNSGVSVGVHVGYMLNNNAGIELAIADKFSSTTTTTQTITTIDTNYTQNGSNWVASGTTSFPSASTYTVKSGLFSLTPSLRLMAGDAAAKMRPYMVTGLIIGFPITEVDYSNAITSGSGANATVTTETGTDTYSGGMTLGFHGALGILVNVSDKIGIFGEVACNLQNWSPGKDVLTDSYTLTGSGFTDVTNTTSTTTYAGSVLENYNAKNGSSVINGGAAVLSNYNNGNGTSASNTTSNASGNTTNITNTQNASYVYLPFSSWGITVGVHINLGGK